MAPEAAATATAIATAPAARPARRPWRKRRPPRRWPGAVELTDDDEDSDDSDAGGGAKPHASAAHTASLPLGLVHTGSASSSPRTAGSALSTPHVDQPDGRAGSSGGGTLRTGSPGQLPDAAAKAAPHGTPTNDRRLSLPSALGDLPNGTTPAGSPGEAARRVLLHQQTSANGHGSPQLPAADDTASPPLPTPPPPFTLPPWWRESAQPPIKLPRRPPRRNQPVPPLEALTPGQWVAALDRALAQFRPAQVVQPGRFGCTIRFLRPPRSLVRVLDRRLLVANSAAEADRHIALPPSQPVLARMADGFYYPAHVVVRAHDDRYLLAFDDAIDDAGLTAIVPRADIVLEGEPAAVAVRLPVGQRVAALWPSLCWRGTADSELADTSPAAVAAAAGWTVGGEWAPPATELMDPAARLHPALIVGHVGTEGLHVVAYDGGALRLLRLDQLILTRHVR